MSFMLACRNFFNLFRKWWIQDSDPQQMYKMLDKIGKMSVSDQMQIAKLILLYNTDTTEVEGAEDFLYDAKDLILDYETAVGIRI